jgi:hypothetical protein
VGLVVDTSWLIQLGFGTWDSGRVIQIAQFQSCVFDHRCPVVQRAKKTVSLGLGIRTRGFTFDGRANVTPHSSLQQVSLRNESHGKES